MPSSSSTSRIWFRASAWISWACVIASLAPSTCALAFVALTPAASASACAASARTWASDACTWAFPTSTSRAAACAWAWSACSCTTWTAAVISKAAFCELASNTLVSSINCRLTASGFDFWTANNCSNTASAATSWFRASSAKAWAFTTRVWASVAMAAAVVAWTVKDSTLFALSWATRVVISTALWIFACWAITEVNCAIESSALASAVSNSADELLARVFAFASKFSASVLISAAQRSATLRFSVWVTTAACAASAWAWTWARPAWTFANAAVVDSKTASDATALSRALSAWLLKLLTAAWKRLNRLLSLCSIAKESAIFFCAIAKSAVASLITHSSTESGFSAWAAINSSTALCATAAFAWDTATCCWA